MPKPQYYQLYAINLKTEEPAFEPILSSRDVHELYKYAINEAGSRQRHILRFDGEATEITCNNWENHIVITLRYIAGSNEVVGQWAIDNQPTT